MDEVINKVANINLDSYRQIMDPPCDDAIQDLFISNNDTFRVQLKNMVTNDSLRSNTLDPTIQKFIDSTINISYTKHDIKMFKRAYEVWERDGMKFIYILFFRSLPYTYMAEKPANVLRMTKLLEKHPDRRIIETAQFIFDVMEKEWWTEKKSGKMTALKIRMLHSSIRYLLLNSLHPNLENGKDNITRGAREESWNMEWGMPISQEDLVATNQVFSLEFIKGMELIGRPLRKTELEAWHYTWNAIGKLMGINEELLSDKIEDAWLLQKSIYKHLFNNKDNRSGILLGKALVTTLEKYLFSEKLVLHLMKNMIWDDEHPEIFYKLFYPTFGSKHPLLFKDVPKDDQALLQHEEELHQDHHEELSLYHEKARSIRMEQGFPKAKRLVLGRHLNQMLSGLGSLLFNVFKINTPLRRPLIDHHLDKTLWALNEHEPDQSKSPERKKFKQAAMHAISGIILHQLANEFRNHKQTGFRIPHDLKENWSIKH